MLVHANLVCNSMTTSWRAKFGCLDSQNLDYSVRLLLSIDLSLGNNGRLAGS